VPPRVTYWTGVWDPAREALSKEVEALRAATDPTAPVVSFSPGQRSALLRSRGVVRLSSRRWVTLRALASVLERRGDVTHVFGGVDEWHLLRALGRRPVVFTVAIPGAAGSPELWHKVSEAGADPERVRVIEPGIDLDLFHPAPAPAGPFRLLFASSPRDPDELDRRGVPLLVELARLNPGIEVVLLWRNWGDVAEGHRALGRLSLPANVIVEGRAGRSMTEIYQSVHAVACCYAEGFGKSAPNSVLEGLACGRPALVTRGCGVVDSIASFEAGAVATRTAQSLADGVELLQRHYARYSARARSLAEERFGLARFRAGYQMLYTQLARGPQASGLGEHTGIGPERNRFVSL
jgi:glycosyltransferase involved in cell wall biosynthesis